MNNPAWFFEIRSRVCSGAVNGHKKSMGKKRWNLIVLFSILVHSVTFFSERANMYEFLSVAQKCQGKESVKSVGTRNVRIAQSTELRGAK